MTELPLVVRVDKRVKLVVPPRVEETKQEGSVCRKGQVILQICEDDADNTVLVWKSFPWPASEPHPHILSVDRTSNHVVLKNETTIARIPFRYFAAKSITEPPELEAPAKQYASFAEAELEASEAAADEGAEDEERNHAQAVVKAAKRMADDKESDSKWKKLRKRLHESKLDRGSLAAQLSSKQQKSLLNACEERARAAEETESVIIALLEGGAFGYKMLDDVYDLAARHSLHQLRARFLKSDIVVSERTFVRLLQESACKPAREGQRELKRLLARRFGEASASKAAAERLSATEAAILVERCTAIYEEEKEQKIQDKALSLLSVLLNSHSLEFLSDSTTHRKVLATAATIADYAAMTISMLELDKMTEARSLFKKTTIRPDYEIRKIRLVERNWVKEE